MNMPLILLLLVIGFLFFIQKSQGAVMSKGVLAWTPEELKKKFTNNTAYDYMLILEAQKHNIPFEILKSIACIESYFGKNKGVIGNMFQITEIACKDVERVFEIEVDRQKLKTDDTYCADIACIFIKCLFEYSGVSSYKDMIICYNSGYTDFKNGVLHTETKNYLSAMQKLTDSFKTIHFFF